MNNSPYLDLPLRSYAEAMSDMEDKRDAERMGPIPSIREEQIDALQYLRDRAEELRLDYLARFADCFGPAHAVLMDNYKQLVDQISDLEGLIAQTKEQR